MQERLIGLIVIVSGLAALAGWLLVERVNALTVAGGAAAAALALLGIVVLVRAVVLVEREEGRR